MCDINAKDHTIECPIDSWFDHALDSPNDDRWSVAATGLVKKRLKKQRHLTKAGWKTWAQVIRNPGDVSEDDIYQHFTTMANQICKAAYYVNKDLYQHQTGLVHTTPTAGTSSDVRLPLHKPDGRVSLLPDESEMSERQLRLPRKAYRAPTYYNHTSKLVSTKTARCAGLAEFKKRLEDAPENDRQLLSGVNHLMYNDPNRRFVLAVTIEGTSTRVWRFDRGMVLVSTRFDCESNPEYLIRVILYLSYASHTQVGFDPTVKAATGALNKKGLTDYVYQIKGKFYRTLDDPLSESNASLLISRGVRVWCVKECDEGGIVKEGATMMVLKDVWLWDGSRHEKEIQDEILGALGKVDEQSPLNREEPSRVDQMKEFFLTITEVERININGQQDLTVMKPADATQISFAVAPPSTTDKQKQALRETQQSLPSSGLSPYILGARKAPQQLQHHRRVHVRYVVKEYCQTIYDTRDIRVALTIFGELTRALDLFRQANFMHRDISGGNCMVYALPEEEGKYHAKLADLEFCKSYHATAVAHDPVSGTFEFMPVESGLQHFQFMADDSPSANPSNLDEVRAKVAAKNANLFFWHPYHDLESLYWVFVWYIISWFPSPSGKPHVTVEQFEAWSSARLDLFNSTRSTFLSRLNLFQDVLPLITQLIDGWGWPKEVVTAYVAPLTFNRLLRIFYKNIQALPWDAATRKWPVQEFTEEPYRMFEEALRVAHDKLGSGRAVPMNSLSSV